MFWLDLRSEREQTSVSSQSGQTQTNSGGSREKHSGIAAFDGKR